MNINVAERTRALELDLGDTLDLIAARFPEHNVVGLRAIVGDALLAQIMSAFAGMYTRMPPARQILRALEDMRLVRLWWEYQASKSAKANDVHLKLRAFSKQAERMRMGDHAVAANYARKLAKEQVSAALWNHALEKKAKARS